MARAWEQPRQNSADALRQGLARFDGIEFDVRLAADGVPVLHHDREVAEHEARDERRYAEQYSSEELAACGIVSFESLMDDPLISEPLAAGDRLACIELKIPHRRTRLAWGRTGERRLMEQILPPVVTALDDAGVPHRSVLFYGFSKAISTAVAAAAPGWSPAPLRPALAPWGSNRVEKWRSGPDYISHPLARNIRRQRRLGAPVMPLVMEYFQPPERRWVLGLSVGFEGPARERLDRIRAGYPLHVWPVKPSLERQTLELGLTALTDHGSPELVTLPDGSPRWTEPACRPLDPGTWKTLRGTPVARHAEALSEARADQARWHELDDSERRTHLTTWAGRWNWPIDIETEIRRAADDGTLPWEAVRLIGHRGTGQRGGDA